MIDFSFLYRIWSSSGMYVCMYECQEQQIKTLSTFNKQLFVDCVKLTHGAMKLVNDVPLRCPNVKWFVLLSNYSFCHQIFRKTNWKWQNWWIFPILIIPTHINTSTALVCWAKSSMIDTREYPAMAHERLELGLARSLQVHAMRWLHDRPSSIMKCTELEHMLW